MKLISNTETVCLCVSYEEMLMIYNVICCDLKWINSRCILDSRSSNLPRSVTLKLDFFLSGWNGFGICNSAGLYSVALGGPRFTLQRILCGSSSLEIFRCVYTALFCTVHRKGWHGISWKLLQLEYCCHDWVALSITGSFGLQTRQHYTLTMQAATFKICETIV